MNIKELKAEDRKKAPPFGKKDGDEKAEGSDKKGPPFEKKGPPAPPKPKGKTPHMKGSSPMADEDSERLGAEEEVIATDEKVADAELENIGKSAPQPSVPIPAADVKAWVDAVNEVSGALSGGQVPPIAVELPERADVWNQPLPAAVFGVCMLINEAIQQAAPGQFDALLFDPVALGGTPEGVVEMTDKLKTMARDGALKEALLKAPADSGAQAVPPAPAPGEGPMPPMSGDTQIPMV